MNPWIAIVIAAIVVGGSVYAARQIRGSEPPDAEGPGGPGDPISELITPPDLNKYLGKSRSALPSGAPCDEVARNAGFRIDGSQFVAWCEPRYFAGFQYGCSCAVAQLNAAGTIIAAQFVCPAGIGC